MEAAATSVEAEEGLERRVASEVVLSQTRPLPLTPASLRSIKEPLFITGVHLHRSNRPEFAKLDEVERKEGCSDDKTGTVSDVGTAEDNRLHITETSKKRESTSLDDDLEPPRKRPRVLEDAEIVDLVHTNTSTVRQCGGQLWRASLLLADVLVSHAAELKDLSILEMGAGVGLVGLIASRSTNLVYMTDSEGVALDMCKHNVEINSTLFSPEKIRVLPLNWLSAPPVTSAWGEVDRTNLSNIDLFIAADVIYDDDLTDAFLASLAKILALCKHRPRPALLLAVEKRIIFSAETLRDESPAFDHFLAQVKMYSDASVGTFFEELGSPPKPVWWQQGESEKEVVTTWAARRLLVDAYEARHIPYGRSAELLLFEVRFAA